MGLSAQSSSPENNSRRSNTVWTWGNNKNYLLGSGKVDYRPVPEELDFSFYERDSHVDNTDELEAKFEMNFNQIAISKFHVVMTTDYEVFVYGFGVGGRLGLGHELTVLTPTLLTGYSGKPNLVAAGPDHTLLVTSDGKLWSWGKNDQHQLGYSIDDKNQLVPREVSLRKEIITKIAASKYHSVACTSNGSIYQWGTNTGQLGYKGQYQVTPRKVTIIPQLDIRQVEVSDHATLILAENFSIYIICQGVSKKIGIPVRPVSFSRLEPNRPKFAYPVKLKCGADLAAVVLSDGSVFLWKTFEENINFKLIWDSTRRKFTATDCAIESLNSVLILTKNGLVLQGTDNKKRGLCFQQIPNLSHIDSIYASPDGTFSAIRSDLLCKTLPKLKSYPAADFGLPILNEKRKDHDFKFILGDSTHIYAHTVVLATRSEWFRNALAKNILLTELNCSNFDGNAVLEVLHLMYNGEIDQVRKTATAQTKVWAFLKPCFSSSALEFPEKYYNTCVTLNGGLLRCHSLALSLKSEFFDRLFGCRSSWTLPFNKEGFYVVELKHIEKELFALVWNWILNENDSVILNSIPRKNFHNRFEVIIQILEIADELMISNLVLFCSNYLAKFLKVTNALRILQIATQFNATELVNITSAFSK